MCGDIGEIWRGVLMPREPHRVRAAGVERPHLELLVVAKVLDGRGRTGGERRDGARVCGGTLLHVCAQRDRHARRQLGRRLARGHPADVPASLDEDIERRRAGYRWRG